jgi:ABC-2 type transport system permease protein
MAVLLPVVLMLMFVYVFGGAISAVPQYVDYVVPGIVLLCSGFVSAATAVSVATDMTGGLMDRFRSMPLRPSAVLVGHVVGSVVRNVVSTTLVIGVAFAVGFRPSAGPVAWLGVGGLLVLWALAITWVAVWLGLLASSPEAASGFTFAVLFLPYVSSAFVPPETMPRVLEAIATYQPVTPVTDTLRAWLLGADLGANPSVALAWCLGIGVVAWTGAVTVFRRRTAR